MPKSLPNAISDRSSLAASVYALLFGALVLTGGCQLRPHTFDHSQINARYSMKYKQPCSAWLRSAKTGYMYCSSPAFNIIPDTVEGLRPFNIRNIIAGHCTGWRACRWRKASRVSTHCSGSR